MRGQNTSSACAGTWWRFVADPEQLRIFAKAVEVAFETFDHCDFYDGTDAAVKVLMFEMDMGYPENQEAFLKGLIRYSEERVEDWVALTRICVFLHLRNEPIPPLLLDWLIENVWGVRVRPKGKLGGSVAGRDALLLMAKRDLVERIDEFPGIGKSRNPNRDRWELENRSKDKKIERRWECCATGGTIPDVLGVAWYRFKGESLTYKTVEGATSGNQTPLPMTVHAEYIEPNFPK